MCSKSIKFRHYCFINVTGTGKTRTSIDLLSLFCDVNQLQRKGDKHNQVIFCGPTNKSVDVAGIIIIQIIMLYNG